MSLNVQQLFLVWIALREEVQKEHGSCPQDKILSKE
jgi:hypothetical protein